MTAHPDDEAPHLLIVDDDRRIRTLLNRFLREEGFRVTMAEDAAAARDKMRGLSFDLLILDVMMPGETGIELATDLRQTMNVPILMLTARAEAANRIEGLESGADDYLAKPFEPRELVLRIRSILKRAESAPARPKIESVKIGMLTFHLQRGELSKEDESIRLTERERDLLRIFCSQPCEIVSRLALVEEGSAGSERAVDVQINRLRRKIEVDPTNPIFLQTVRGAGYRLMIDEW